MKVQQTNDHRKLESTITINPGPHPGSFALNSVKSRAAARALLESRPKPEIVFSLADSPRPRFV
jgi:hypothetical protein